jgi:hypothetical protein
MPYPVKQVAYFLLLRRHQHAPVVRGVFLFVPGFSFVDRPNGQYTNCEPHHTLKIYRVWANTIPSGNNLSAHCE